MTEKLPAKERIAMLTARLEALNHNFTLDMQERLIEIQQARAALEAAERDLAHGR